MRRIDVETSTVTEPIHDLVREHYADAARAVQRRLDAPGRPALPVVDDGCCSSRADPLPAALYSPLELADLPAPAVLASLGCGNPVVVADLQEGEIVLDLGSGGGIDVLLSAKRVGPAGHAIGLDMTDEMLELARRNAADAGVSNVTFLRGTIEDMPLPDASVDVVISNCVVDLAADKPAVFREIARVLRPGGRIGISDIVASNELSPDERLERGSYAGCIAGALSFAEYEAGLREAGLQRIEIVTTQAVGDGMHSAIVRAVKP